jgi:hypothetical protein
MATAKPLTARKKVQRTLMEDMGDKEIMRLYSGARMRTIDRKAPRPVLAFLSRVMAEMRRRKLSFPKQDKLLY